MSMNRQLWYQYCKETDDIWKLLIKRLPERPLNSELSIPELENRNIEFQKLNDQYKKVCTKYEHQVSFHSYSPDIQLSEPEN